MSEHHAIHTGAGWRCQRCGVSWDQGEGAPEGCRVDSSLPGSQGGADGHDVSVLTMAEQRQFFGPTPLGGHHVMLPKLDISDEELEARMASTKQPTAAEGVQALIDNTGFELHADGVLRPPSSDPMANQVGGRHYKDLAIQPTEFAQKNGYDFCSGSILKYLTRHRMKNGVEDLRKARHFVEIREAIGVFAPVKSVIGSATYIMQRGIDGRDSLALSRLAYYVWAANDADRQRHVAALIQEIDYLIAAYG